MFCLICNFLTKNNLKKYIKRLTFIEIVLIQICLFYCFAFGDFIATTKHGLILLDCISEGSVRSFYNVVVKQYVPAYYDFVIYVIFAVWNLPLWLAQKSGLVQDPLDSILGFVWAKSIILFFASVCLFYMWKILRINGQYSKYDLVFIFATDLLITAGLCIMGQYDIITVSFIIAGLYYYLIGNEKKFIIAFAFAIPIKAFAFLLFCPLLVQKEKTIIKIILKGLIVLMPIVFCRLFVPMSANPQQMIPLYLGKVLGISLPMSNGFVSFFIVSYTALVVYCYIHPFKNILYSSIVTSAFVFAIFLLFSNPHPQWWVHIAPFIILLIFLNKNKNVVHHLLAVIGELMLLLPLIRTYYYVFNPNNLARGILNQVIHIEASYVNGPLNMFDFLFSKTSIRSDFIFEIILSLGFACILSFVFISRKSGFVDNKFINSKSNLLFTSFFLRSASVVLTYILIFFQLKFV